MEQKSKFVSNEVSTPMRCCRSYGRGTLLLLIENICRVTYLQI